MLVGHSLGGKVAMVTTLTHPDLVRSLVVVDIAPKDYGDLDRFVHYIEAMRALPLDELTGRADAEQRFAAVEPDAGVRGFLLQNLRRQRHHLVVAGQPRAARPGRRPRHRLADRRLPRPRRRRPTTGPVVWLVGGDSELRQGRRHRGRCAPCSRGPDRSSSTVSATGCTARPPRWSPRRCAACCACCPPTDDLSVGRPRPAILGR